MEICVFCGDEIIDGGVTLYDHTFCSEECMEAYREETYGFLEEEDDLEI
jgi:hypothetical protein